MQPFGRYRLLCIEMYKNNKFYSQCVFITTHSSRLHPEMTGGGATAPLAPLNPPLASPKVSVYAVRLNYVLCLQEQQDAT